MVTLLPKVDLFTTGIARADTVTGTTYQVSGNEMTLGQEITAWVPSADGSYVYAVSKTKNSLLYINTATFQVDNVRNVGSGPSDITLGDNGKLYIALSGESNITVVDTVYGASINGAVSTISIQSPSDKIAEGHNKLYYVTGDSLTQGGVDFSQWDELNVKDLSTGQTAILRTFGSVSYYNPDIEIDNVQNLLYVGETGNSGCKLYAFDTTNNTLVSQTNTYGYSSPPNKVVIDNDYVYYAGQKIDKHDMNKIYGTLASDKAIVSIGGSRIFTQTAVYDQVAMNRLFNTPFKAGNVYVKNDNTVYVYQYQDASPPAQTALFYKILKFGSIAEYQAYAAQAGAATVSGVTYHAANNAITLGQEITAWVPSSDGSYIYAISRSTDSLLYINTASFTIERVVNVGSSPSDIKLGPDGKLYIALTGASFISEVDPASGQVSRIPVTYPSNSIAVGNNKVFYNTGDDSGVVDYSQWDTVYAVDLSSGHSTNINGNVYGSFYNPKIEIDNSLNRLYVGDTFEKLIVYDTANYGVVDQTNNTQYGNASGQNIWIEGNNLYFRMAKVDKTNVNTVYGTYPAANRVNDYSFDRLIYADNSYVFTDKAIYNGADFSKLFIVPFDVGQAYVKNDGTVYVYQSSPTSSVLKFASLDAFKQYAQSYSTSISVSQPSVYLPLNGTAQINVTATDELNRTTDVTHLATYASSAPNVATAADGVITALSEGSAMITVTYQGGVASIFVTVSSGAVTGGGGGGGGSGGMDDTFLFLSEYSFLDQDPVRGGIHPLITWKWSVIEGISMPDLSGFQLSFADSNGSQLGEPIVVNQSADSSTTYQEEIPEGAIPQGAMFVDLRTIDTNHIVSVAFKRVPIYDLTLGSTDSAIQEDSAIPAPVLGALSQSLDTDPSIGHIGGEIGWGDRSTDQSANSYALYYVDAHNKKLQQIAEIPRNSSVFDYNNPFSYTIHLPNGTAFPAGAQRIGIFGENAQGVGTSGFYMGLWDYVDSPTVNNYIEDSNSLQNQITQHFHWVPYISEANIKDYEIEFTQQYGDFLQGQPDVTVPAGKKQYDVSVTADQIPAGAKYANVFVVNDAGDYQVISHTTLADNMEQEAVSTFTQDASLSSPQYVSAWDADGDAGSIGGGLYFSVAQDSPGNRYDVYFVNDQLQKVMPIISIPSYQTSQANPFGGFYESRIPMHTVIPQGATKIAVYTVSPANGTESAPGTTLSIPGVLQGIPDSVASSPLTLDQVAIQNNASGTPDTISVNGLHENDVVRVYSNADDYIPLASGTADANGTVAISIPQLGTGTGSVYLSLQKASNILPSARIQKTYIAEAPSQSPPPLGGGAGGGGGGGGGVSFPVPDGNGKMTYDVQPSHVDMVIDLANDAKKELTLDATANQHLDITTVSFGADIVQKAAEKGKPIVIKANDVQLTFPVNALTVNNNNDTVKLKVSSEDSPTVSNFNAVSPLVEFTLTEKDTAITAFNKPIEAVFHYDSSKVKDPGNLGVYWLDEATNTWTYMGGTVNGDGTITATLPHFSKYAVLEKTAAAETVTKTFGDIQGHWAQKDIERLASMHIVDGMDESSFQPDSSMTRAQFVTILKKALNLQTQATTKLFTDVAADSWYKDSVYATYAANIVSGTSDSTFAPETNVTREQLAVMMVNAYLNATGKKLSDIVEGQPVSYADSSDISDWAKQYVAAATTIGLLNGVDDTHFAPAQNSTRAQVATVVVRMLKQIKAMK
jgi:hypothetical protein